jgi:hypothetical protein
MEEQVEAERRYVSLVAFDTLNAKAALYAVGEYLEFTAGIRQGCRGSQGIIAKNRHVFKESFGSR